MWHEETKININEVWVREKNIHYYLFNLIKSDLRNILRKLIPETKKRN